jgi:hypothetical protein
VLIVVGSTGAAGRLRLQYQECVPGDVAVIPPAAWHLTYVLNGPAMVFNIYANQGQSGVLAGPGLAKYRSGRGPVPVAVVRLDSSFAFTWGTRERVPLTEPTAATRPEWLGSFLRPGASLADWCAHAPDAELLALAGAAAGPRQ